MTYAGSIVNLLAGGWGLASPLSSTELAFAEGWYNDQFLDRPQVTVTDMSAPVGQFYMGTWTVTFHYRFLVNTWYRLPAGVMPGTVEQALANSMGTEVFRIINTNRHNIGDLEIILAEGEGTPRHELDRNPRMLRYELVAFGVETDL